MGENLKRTKEVVDAVDRVNDMLVGSHGISHEDISFASMNVVNLSLLPDIALSLASIADSLEAMKNRLESTKSED